MKPVHAIPITLLIALAAALGALGATKMTAATQVKAAAPHAAGAAWITSRQARLNRWQRQLGRALHRRSPKLPKLVKFAPVATPAPRAPVYVRSAHYAAAVQRTVYVHAAARPSRPAPAGERDHEGGKPSSHGGGQYDD